MLMGPIPPPHDLLEIFDISDEDTGVVNEDDDDVEEVGSGMEPGLSLIHI